MISKICANRLKASSLNLLTVMTLFPGHMNLPGTLRVQ